MKFKDLLIEYSEIEGMRVFTVLNHQSYLAFRNKEDDKEVELVRPLRLEEIKALQNKTLSIKELYNKKAWMEYEAFEKLWKESFLKRLLRECQEKIANPKCSGEISQVDATTVEWFMKTAEKGDPDVMYHLGLLYADGRGVKQDDIKAVYCYRKAAQANNPEAMLNIGKAYLDGKGIMQDSDTGIYWCEKSARTGNISAMQELASIYKEGKHVARNGSKAIYWRIKGIVSNPIAILTRLIEK